LSHIEFLIVSAALGMDLFSVAIPIGMQGVKARVIVRAALVFALFHIVLILAGYYIGHFLGSVVEQFSVGSMDHPMMAMQNWASLLGALVLVGLGLYMIKEHSAGTVPNRSKQHPLQGISLLILATSVSIDALAAGFSMGMMDVDLIALSMILGMVIFAIAVLGLSLGRRVGQYMGHRAELAGGLILILLGLHILWSLLYS